MITSINFRIRFKLFSNLSNINDASSCVIFLLEFLELQANTVVYVFKVSQYFSA